MPSWLLWLAPAPLATLGAVAWTAWTGRERGPEEPTRTVAAHERFRQALVPRPDDPAP